MIIFKTPEEIAVMREGGRRLARILAALRREVSPGIETAVLDRRARELVAKEGVRAAFLNYKPAGAIKAFPAALCVSVNEVVVHGVPGTRVIKEGDVVKLDMGVIHGGFYLDSAVTVGAGKTSKDVERLLGGTRRALEDAIKMAKPGHTLGGIGYAVSRRIEREKLGIVKALTGHGIGRNLHEDPHVLNVGRRGEGEPLRVGMVLAIEPMVALGDGDVRQLKDDSFVTADNSPSAHFEHTVAITEKGNIVLTEE